MVKIKSTMNKRGRDKINAIADKEDISLDNTEV